jgi:beta-glucanase (GH16 family)
LPTYNQYGEWPASGEIDIMESRGNDASYPAGGVDTFTSTLHWGPYYLEDGYLKTSASKKAASGDFSQGFHTYGLIWNETYMGTYLDDPSNVVLSVPITETFWNK